MKMLTIGQLAKMTNSTVVTIRYYEKIGLLPKIERSFGGYRQYPESLIARFNFISNAKFVGFNLAEIKILFDLQAKKNSSNKVKEKTQEKIRLIDEKLKLLKQIKRNLSQWEKACDGLAPIDKCPILANLYSFPSKDNVR